MEKKEKPVILISDMHADRWDRTKKERFFEFLEYVEKTAREVLILGDIFDFPPLKGDTIWPKHKDLVSRITALPAKGVPVLYMIGNHDISLRGIELSENGFTMTYCDNKRPYLREIFDKKIYIEHGHYYDPLFQDHIYDAIDFLKSVTGQAVDKRAVDFWRDVVRILQRNPKTKVEKKVEKEQIGVPERFLKIWEQASEQIMKRMRIDIVFFGHTHAPMIVEMVGGNQWYVNTGDWVMHSSYVELSKKGIVLKDWIQNSVVMQAEFRK